MKLAIIGASTGQTSLTLKAKELGHTVISFAWGEGAVCKDIADKFYPISILETEKIIEICKQEGVEGVVSNASDLTAEISAYVATQLGLISTDYHAFATIKDKATVRKLTQDVTGLAHVKNFKYTGEEEITYPCVIKPTTGCGKKGVSFVNNEKEFQEAIAYAKENSNCAIMVEQFIGGQEISVETLSYKGKHHIIQITDKENDGIPHFVELSHHMPANISDSIKGKIQQVIPQILSNVGITNGASHTEMKIFNDEVYLIEVNPRGGGDQITDLVQHSNGYDYVKGMIDVALGTFEEPVFRDKGYAGIFFLCEQRRNRLKYFQEKQPWEIARSYDPTAPIVHSISNYDRGGWIVYSSEKKILIDGQDER